MGGNREKKKNAGVRPSRPYSSKSQKKASFLTMNMKFSSKRKIISPFKFELQLETFSQ